MKKTMPSSANSPLAQLPFLAILAVFIPIVLTVLTAHLMGIWIASLIAVFPMFPFLLYALWNWLVIGVGFLFLRRRKIAWRDIGFANFRLPDM
jgi:hypothetical protein